MEESTSDSLECPHNILSRLNILDSETAHPSEGLEPSTLHDQEVFSHMKQVKQT